MPRAALAGGGYTVEPYSPPTGPFDSAGSDMTVSFFDLPLWIQLSWAAGALVAGFTVLKFGPVVLARIRNILKNEKRREILEYVGQNPGCTTADIVRDMNLNRGTAKYHIYLLGLESKVTEKKDGKMRYLFRNGGIRPEKKQVYGYIRNPTKREILMTIFREPGISNLQIAERMQLDKSTVHWHLSRFLEERIVDSVWDGRNMNYTVTDDVAEILKTGPAG
ncbi:MULTISPECIES: winged helix-turn-helix transcriptional regulator [unclassified Methanoregula]|uniref:winged helix-turn-helix transcriptional regulator n=1 Tax=unclassified Methanoregula TaxID=2649730 RepID=UPI0025E51BAB|nr:MULTISPECIES: winged helix-turn-helix transcriptional regulator [unclassified Methanoregula]